MEAVELINNIFEVYHSSTFVFRLLPILRTDCPLSIKPPVNLGNASSPLVLVSPIGPGRAGRMAPYDPEADSQQIQVSDLQLKADGEGAGSRAREALVLIGAGDVHRAPLT